MSKETYRRRKKNCKRCRYSFLKNGELCCVVVNKGETTVVEPDDICPCFEVGGFTVYNRGKKYEHDLVDLSILR
jgi:hypothetical protein